MRIVLNDCFGGFQVTKLVYDKLGLDWDEFGFLSNEHFGIVSGNCLKFRTNEKLIKALEEIGLDKAAGNLARLEIVYLGHLRDNDWFIENDYGFEKIVEN